MEGSLTLPGDHFCPGQLGIRLFGQETNLKKKTKNTLYRYPTVIMLGPRDTPQGPLGLTPTGGPVAAPSSPGDEEDEAREEPLV